MKVIDLLNKIANEEVEPNIFIKYRNKIYQYTCTFHDFEDKEGDYLFDKLGREGINFLKYPSTLNEEIKIVKGYDEVEIMEEDKKIEKLNNEVFEEPFVVINKINEIIDYINKGDKE